MARADPVWQRRHLDEIRPRGANPMQPSIAPPTIDQAFDEGPSAAGVDDLHDARLACTMRTVTKHRPTRRPTRRPTWRPTLCHRRHTSVSPPRIHRSSCHALRSRSSKTATSIPTSWRRRSPNSTPNAVTIGPDAPIARSGEVVDRYDRVHGNVRSRGDDFPVPPACCGGQATPLPPVAGEDRQQFINQAKTDYQDYAMIGDAVATIEDGMLTLRIDLRPADQRD